jgi:hypothetical protein
MFKHIQPIDWVFGVIVATLAFIFFFAVTAEAGTLTKELDTRTIQDTIPQGSRIIGCYTLGDMHTWLDTFEKPENCFVHFTEQESVAKIIPIHWFELRNGDEAVLVEVHHEDWPAPVYTWLEEGFFNHLVETN